MTKEEKNGFSYRIMQASPTDLIVILYEMAQNYLNNGIHTMEKGEEDSWRNEFKHAHGVMNELIHSLDMNYEISMQLLQIYVYVKRAIIRASVSKNSEELVRCVAILEKLKKSFAAISSEDKRGPVMENTQQVYAGLTYGRGTLNESFGPESNRGFRV
ncbi:MAG: flagellar protein FliS [Lachnospiraceae bacterium]